MELGERIVPSHVHVHYYRSSQSYWFQVCLQIWVDICTYLDSDCFKHFAYSRYPNICGNPSCLPPLIPFFLTLTPDSPASISGPRLSGMQTAVSMQMKVTIPAFIPVLMFVVQVAPHLQNIQQ